MALAFDSGRNVMNAEATYSHGIGTGAFSISLWFNGDTAPDAFSSIITGNTSNWVLAQTTSASSAWGWYDDTIGTIDNFTTVLSTGVWQHLCVVRSGTTVTGYVDGSADADTITTAHSIPNDALFIGGRYDGSGQAMDGRLAEVAIWDVALTAAEVSALAQGYMPLMVHPQSVVMYLGMAGIDSDDERDIVSGIAWQDTTAGSAIPPTAYAHPRIIYPPPMSWAPGNTTLPTIPRLDLSWLHKQSRDYLEPQIRM